MSKRLLAFVALAILSFASAADAQNFPSKPIRIIVPFTPGGTPDVVAREIATGLQARLGQPVVVENKPGGGGTIAYAYVAKSPADGYTLLSAPASFTISPHLSRNAGYNPVTEFAAINRVADVPLTMVVPNSLPVHSVAEFIQLAKSSPDKLTFGSVGVGTPMHLASEFFKLKTGTDLIHVPFRGATVLLPDLIAGRIDMFIGAINSLLPLIQDGKLRALAATSAKRIPSLADVPTMAELGYPDFEVGSGAGFVAPAGTPPAVIELLNAEMLKIIADPALHQRMAQIGVEIVGNPPDVYGKFIRDDYARWAQVVAAAGIKPE